jgi:very-short-patch-repair endonuclease
LICYNIEVARHLAHLKGGECLSDIYINNKEHLRWRCAYGHEWDACLGKIKNSGQWYPYCGGKKKLTIHVAQQIAAERGGKCLSTEYTNCYAQLLWECSELHQWIACLHDIKNGGTWCPVCAGNMKLTIEDAHRTAHERGGECLSNIYVNIMENLKWRCEFGHEWNATLNNVKNKHQWCPICGGTKKLTIVDAQQIAAERGGKCLSTEYINCDSLLQWQCEFLHTWLASINNIKNKGSWCPECAGVTKWTIEELDDIAIKNGGRLLSNQYINSQTHLEWICGFGHNWFAIPNSIVRGSWCPTCNVSRGERTISDWLIANNIQFIPQYSFTGSRYSYDFYIPSTGWLIEFDGLQHFKEVPFFHNKIPFQRRQDIDREKTQMAYSKGLSLLHIHYYDIMKIADLLPVITVKTPPHVVCSRTDGYEYLNLKFSHNPKPLTLVVIK